jgi:hypothetical protein
MALSPQYSWPEPDNSSLVKNGAADIRTLGDAIDTSVWNVGFGQAGKNKIINGDFSINQRSATSTTTTNTFVFDRFALSTDDGTSTYSAQTFTAGAAPVAGYEATNFARLVSTGQTLNTAFTAIGQKIENVRTFAGQTVTMSFWAKASTGTPNVAVSLWQDFGSGGSPSATTQQGSKLAITSSWARYSATFTLASLSGKTIGTNANSSLRTFLITSAGSTRDAYTGALGIQSVTIDFWGVQVEYGSKATPFQTASGGSPQAELAMCQRYYYRFQPTSAVTNRFGYGFAVSTTAGEIGFKFPVNMRTAPTALEQSGTASDYGVKNGATNTPLTSVPTFNTADTTEGFIGFGTAAVLTLGSGTCMRNSSTNAYLGWSAEL